MRVFLSSDPAKNMTNMNVESRHHSIDHQPSIWVRCVDEDISKDDEVYAVISGEDTGCLSKYSTPFTTKLSGASFCGENKVEKGSKMTLVNLPPFHDEL